MSQIIQSTCNMGGAGMRRILLIFVLLMLFMLNIIFGT